MMLLKNLNVFNFLVHSPTSLKNPSISKSYKSSQEIWIPARTGKLPHSALFPNGFSLDFGWLWIPGTFTAADPQGSLAVGLIQIKALGLFLNLGWRERNGKKWEGLGNKKMELMSGENVIFSHGLHRKKSKHTWNSKDRESSISWKFLRGNSCGWKMWGLFPQAFFPIYNWEAKPGIFNDICTKIWFSPLHSLPRRKILIEEDPSCVHFSFQHF